MKLPCTPTQVKNLLVKCYDDSDNQKILIKTRALANEKKRRSWVTGLIGVQGVTVQTNL